MRRATYSEQLVSVLAMIWEAAGYLCSVRLKAAIPLWIPWVRKRLKLSDLHGKQLKTISASQIDRRLRSRKNHLKKRMYGRTKPGTLLKHHIPIKTDHWNVTTPGYTEVDTVSHSGNSAEGVFGYTVNQTDIFTTWVESRAILGKGEAHVVDSLRQMACDFPFPTRGIDSDNGSEFINYHLYRYCQKHNIQFTRSRPYKKDDNAHIEQKNWTHVRKLAGWVRYDSDRAIAALNDLYKNELRVLMNLFTPSMKLQRKIRVGSKVRKVYDQPSTPLDRVISSKQGDPTKVARLIALRDSLDPFQIAQTIETKLQKIYRLANSRKSPKELNNINHREI